MESRIGFYSSSESNPDPTRTRIIFIGFGFEFFYIGFESDNFTSNRIGFASGRIILPSLLIFKSFGIFPFEKENSLWIKSSSENQENFPFTITTLFHYLQINRSKMKKKPLDVCSTLYTTLIPPF